MLMVETQTLLFFWNYFGLVENLHSRKLNQRKFVCEEIWYSGISPEVQLTADVNT